MYFTQKTSIKLKLEFQVLTEMLMYEDVILCADYMLWIRSLHSATVLYSNCYHTVVASIFLLSTASCKAVASVRS